MFDRCTTAEDFWHSAKDVAFVVAMLGMGWSIGYAIFALLGV